MQATTTDRTPLVAGWLALAAMSAGWLLAALIVAFFDVSVALAPDWPLARTLVFVGVSGAPLVLSGWVLWAAGGTLVRRGPADWARFLEWGVVPAASCVAMVVLEFFLFTYPGW